MEILNKRNDSKLLLGDLNVGDCCRIGFKKKWFRSIDYREELFLVINTRSNGKVDVVCLSNLERFTVDKDRYFKRAFGHFLYPTHQQTQLHNVGELKVGSTIENRDRIKRFIILPQDETPKSVHVLNISSRKLEYLEFGERVYLTEIDFQETN